MDKNIVEFEAQLTKLCEFWRAKLCHADLVGTLDTVKMIYHIKTIQNFEEPEVPVLGNTTNGSPIPE